MEALAVRVVLSAQDTDLISEMSTTTESSNSRGGKTYYPQVKDREHATDALRAARLAIFAVGDEVERGEGSYGGWAGEAKKPFRGVEPDADYHDGDDESNDEELDLGRGGRPSGWAAPWE